MTRFAFLLAIIALCVIQIPTAASCQEMLTVRATSAIPDAVIEYVAKESQPYQITINAGEDPRKTIRNICGAYTEAFVRALSEHNRGFHWGPHPTPRPINMLACLKWRRDIPPVKLLPGEKTLDQVLERVIGVTSDAKVSCAANDPPSKCNFTYKELVQKLNPGSNLDNLTVTSIRLPLSTEPSTFTVRTGRTAVEVQAGINQLVAQHGGADALIYNQLAANISLMTAVSTDNDACVRSSADPAQHWPYDAKAVRAVLERTKSLAQQSQNPHGRAVVTVIDTGLDETKFSAEFLRDFMRINQTPSNGEGRFGIGSFQKGVTKPDNRYAAHLHGTQVADIVAGGSGLRSEYSQLSALIAINVVNLIVPESASKFVIREGDIVSGVSFARDKEAQVANISVGSAKELQTLVDVLDGRRLVLVVAAGNEGKDLGKFALYPGLYGGVHPQIITVAAHDREDRVAEFSNYSGKYADLTAPGCAVPYSIQADAEPAHGTSFAAPLVSMTVALLRAFYVANINIKRRLQAAIDYRPHLASRILWSGKLNIPKTLSLYEDVLERKSKGSRLAFGKWVHSDRIIQACQNEEYLDVHSIAKISILRSEAPYQIRLLEKDAAGALVSHVCEPQSDWKGLNFEDSERPGSTELVPWSDLTDYVRRHFEGDALGGEASSGPALSAGAPSGTFVQAPPQRLGSAK